MPKVAVVTTSYPRDPGDPDGHFVRTEALALAATHASVIVVAPAADRPRRLADPVACTEVPSGGAFGAPGLGARLREHPARALGAARFFAALPAILARSGAEELVVHWPFPTALACGALARALPTTLVSHGACVRALLALPSPLRAHAVRALLRDPRTRWRFVAEHLRDDLAAALDRETRKRLLAASFVQAAAITLPPRESLGPAWPRPAHVVLGRLVPSKRVAEAIAYAARTPDIQCTDIVLIGDGPLRESLVARGRALGLRVHATGTLPRDEALGILAGARGLLFASRAEGLSTALREAAHYGVPVRHVP